MYDSMIFNDGKKHLVAKAEFIRIEDKPILSGFWGKSKTEDQVEFNKVEIKIFDQRSGKEVLVAEGSGNWTRVIHFDGKIYWDRTRPFPTIVEEPHPILLPSSSLNRREMQLIRERKFLEADK